MVREDIVLSVRAQASLEAFGIDFYAGLPQTTNVNDLAGATGLEPDRPGFSN